MPTAEQLPGRLNLAFVRGDTFSTLVDFSISLTGRTLAAELISVPSRQTVMALTVDAVNLSAGQVNVSLTAEQTQSLARGSYEWRLTWTEGAVIRTALEGYVEVA